MSKHTFRTTFTVSFGHGGEHEIDLLLTYRFIRGYPDSFDEPGEPDSAEILSACILQQNGVTATDAPNWMLAILEADEDLISTLAADGSENEAADRDEAEERRWEEFCSAAC